MFILLLTIAKMNHGLLKIKHTYKNKWLKHKNSPLITTHLKGRSNKLHIIKHFKFILHPN